MNHATTLATIFALFISFGTLAAPSARADENATKAQDVAMAITNLIAEATDRRPKLLADDHARAGTLMDRLGILRMQIQSHATDLANRSSQITMKKERVEWLRLYVESAIDQHNQAMDAINAEVRRLNKWGRELKSRIAQHNNEEDWVRTKEQMIAYDDRARRLNDEVQELNKAWAALEIREARDIEPMRLP